LNHRSSSITVDFNGMWKHVLNLSKYRDRIAGTTSIERAAKYIADELEETPGSEVWIDRFPLYTSFPEGAELRIMSPQAKKIMAFPNLFSLNTPSEGLTGEVVYVKGGMPEEYNGIEPRDKIALAELAMPPSRPEKASVASNMGCVGLMVIGWGHPDNKALCRGAIKWRWGPPTREEFEKIPRISSLNISRADGEYIKKLLSQGKKVVGNIKAEVKNKWVSANQPTCRIKPSGKKFDELLIVGGHLESWGGTATDNSTGNAIMLETARALSKNRDVMQREVIMSFWDGHEIGEAAGSAWFLDNYWSELNKRGIAYINIDSVGVKGASQFVSYSSPETWEFLDQVEKEIIGKTSVKNPALKSADNSFLGIGIPYVTTYATYTEEELQKSGNAELGWWYHTEKDTIDKVDRELLETQAELYSAYIWRLVQESILPFNFEPSIHLFISEHKELANRFKKILAIGPFKELGSNIKKLHDAVVELNKQKQHVRDTDIKKIKLVNGLLMGISRILTPSFETVAGKYMQDPYGYSLLANPIPRIYKAASKMAEIEEDTPDYYMLYNELIKETNLLNDSVSEASRLVKSTSL
jgi:hypothetical protein